MDGWSKEASYAVIFLFFMDGSLLKHSQHKILWSQKVQSLDWEGWLPAEERLPCGELLIDGGPLEPISFINQPIHQSQKQAKGLTCWAVKMMISMALIQHTIEDLVMGRMFAHLSFVQMCLSCWWSNWRNQARVWPIQIWKPEPKQTLLLRPIFMPYWPIVWDLWGRGRN